MTAGFFWNQCIRPLDMIAKASRPFLRCALLNRHPLLAKPIIGIARWDTAGEELVPPLEGI